MSDMAHEHPRVSVIIPTYNSSRYVTEAINSVLAGDYADYEIIVADDGSTDDTLKTLQLFGDKITVLKLPHRGISATRNAAIRHSHGELIALLDSDDIWEPQKLRLQTAYLDKHPEFALVYSYSTNFTDTSKGDVAVIRKLDFEGYIFKDLFTKTCFATPTIVMRRSAFDAVGGYDETVMAAEDYDLDLRISRKYQIGRVPKSLLRRRIHPNSFYSSSYNGPYERLIPIYDRQLSDPAVEKIIGVSKVDYMSSFILKFIYKNLYDQRPELVEQKIQDLEKYSSNKASLARKLVASGDLSPAQWRPLIIEFDAWQADVAHKAALFEKRRKI